ncbi:MAG: hypothetical protein SGI98_06400 [Verrucomicrobiota bacterium]|nr:hypothetical protein [Verrucomicrobiota bacterium]
MSTGSTAQIARRNVWMRRHVLGGQAGSLSRILENSHWQVAGGVV